MIISNENKYMSTSTISLVIIDIHVSDYWWQCSPWCPRQPSTEISCWLSPMKNFLFFLFFFFQLCEGSTPSLADIHNWRWVPLFSHFLFIRIPRMWVDINQVGKLFSGKRVLSFFFFNISVTKKLFLFEN